MQDTGERRNKLLLIIVFFGIITAFFYCLIVGTMPKYKSISSREEIDETDLSKDYICLDSSVAEVYRGRLYDRSDFAAGNAEDGDPDAKFETCRLVLSLKKGITYGITGHTATYAQKVYVNGALLSPSGSVSNEPDDFVPRTDQYTAYFTARENETEIIVQHAWFNHRSGAFHKIYLAEQQVIARTDREQSLCDGIMVGTLLAMMIFFFGVFLFYSSHSGMLWFSLSCLCAAVHYLIYESKQIMVLFPNLNWYIGHKIENLSNIYYFMFIAMFAFAMLRIKPKKWFVSLSFTLLLALTVYFIVAPSTFYTKYTVPVSAFVILYDLFTAVWLLYLAAKEGKLKQPDNLIVCATVLLTAVVYIIEGVTYFSHIFYLRSYAMILFAFCNALVLTMSFSRTEKSLNEALLKELEIAEENAMLEKMNNLKSDFMRNIAHEMKTPLTVMSGYAQLTGRQLQKNAVNEETAANLDTIAKEAGRLSDMVTKLLDVIYNNTSAHDRSTFLPSELLDDAAAVCRPILSKNGNKLRLICESRRSITANKESLLQVLINLAINAGKHTRNGTIVFCVTEDAQNGDFVDFYVSDDGAGIAKEDLPHIFERGYGTDGGNGLGLTICRDIIESMNGRIAIEKTDGSGTTVHFTVPAAEGKECI